MANEFTDDQIAELVALEGEWVRRGGSGFRPEVQELIDRLKLGMPEVDDSFPSWLPRGYSAGWRLPMNRFTYDQIAELRALEKEWVHRGGSGLRPEVQELIDLLKQGSVGMPEVDDPFLTQSKVLWNQRWGRELGFTKLDDYRKSLEQDGLGVTPARPLGMPAHLNRCVLWDRRPLLVKEGKMERVSLVKACRLFGVSFVGNGNDDTLIQHEATPEITVPVRWVFCQDGRVNRNREPNDCRNSFQRPEVALEALGGLFLYAQDPTVIGGEGRERHALDLPGSVRRDCPLRCACLGFFGGRPELFCCWVGDAVPWFGSASRRE